MIKLFSQISSEDVLTCGGKGASLGEMTQAGFLVPGGFVLTTEGFGVDSTIREKQVHEAFDNLSCQFVAVRSSGTKEDGDDDSFAGQFDTYLFVTRDQLINKTKECHESINSERVKSYCSSKGIDIKSIKVAVVVQKMINSDIAGVCFTINPITNNPDEVMIEGGYGVGEAVVSGFITPDNYIVNKHTNHIGKSISTQTIKLILDTQHGGVKEDQVESTIVSSQKLSDIHILELTHQAKLIEQHYGKPMDIERAIEDGKLYILQARPVTSLGLVFTKPLKKEGYMLSFWAGGFTVLLTDICTDMYRKLGVLLVLYYGEYRQYFELSAYQNALKEGLVFYSTEGEFDRYKENLDKLYNNIVQSYSHGIGMLSLDDTKKFFGQCIEILSEYNKMNFEYTDKAYSLRDTSEIIAQNLEKISIYKDEIRAFLNTIFFESNSYFTSVLEQLSSQFDIPVEQLESYTQEEIYGLFGGNTIDSSVIESRQACFIGDAVNNRCFEGEKALSIALQFEDTIDLDQTIIVGTCASRGFIRGTVKLILVDYSDFEALKQCIDDMKQGDILVAETTAPELMAACQKAGAIVTDMGGMISHAAIVSRELGIPCIVGTKHASRILKDGDLVEVDATNGIIKIISN